jgi:hypothetical protein
VSEESETVYWVGLSTLLGEQTSLGRVTTEREREKEERGSTFLPMRTGRHELISMFQFLVHSKRLLQRRGRFGVKGKEEEGEWMATRTGTAERRGKKRKDADRGRATTEKNDDVLTGGEGQRERSDESSRTVESVIAEISISTVESGKRWRSRKEDAQVSKRAHVRAEQQHASIPCDCACRAELDPADRGKG